SRMVNCSEGYKDLVTAKLSSSRRSIMVQTAKAQQKEGLFTGGFSGFSVRDAAEAKQFYADVLGLDVSDNMGGLKFRIPSGDNVFVYEKSDHEPATFTVFNLQVADIAKAVEQLSTRGVKFLEYDGEIATDDNGIHWGAKNGNDPNIAWFEDPS